jgi:hypothetical protein
MATRTKPNWKVLDRLWPMLEQEGWSHAQIAEDWGIALTTLEGHLTQEVPIVKKPEINWTRFDELKALGFPMTHISEAMGIPRTTLRSLAKNRDQEQAQQSMPVQTAVQSVSTGAESSAESSAESDEPVQTTVQSVSTGAESSVESSAETHEAVQSPVQPTETSVETGAESSAESDVPVHTAVQKVDTGTVQTLDTGAVQRIDQLEEDVRQLAELMRSVMDRMNQIPVQTPMQITALPAYPKGKAVRWNLWILDAIQDEIKILAAERDVSPSQLVQEMLWKELRRE